MSTNETSMSATTSFRMLRVFHVFDSRMYTNGASMFVRHAPAYTKLYSK